MDILPLWDAAPEIASPVNTRNNQTDPLPKIEWLPSKIRRGVMTELGLSLQKWKSDIEEGRTLTLNVLVDQCKARMRENGEQPRGGIHDSAVAEIAARQGMTAEALKQRITRLNKKRSRK